MSGRLDGKVAIITGGASGIGEAGVRRSDGGLVVRFAFDSRRCAPRRWHFPRRGSVARERRAARRSEQSSGDGAERRRSETSNTNNAGVAGDKGRIHETPEDVFDRIIAVNLKGVWLGTKHAVTQMLAQGHGGAIVNTASLSSLVGIERQGAYGSAKGGVAQLTLVTAVEYAADGIRCNSVCPGGILTPLIYGGEGSGGPDAATAEAFLARAQPIPRAGRPLDVADAAVYLASDEASFVTGHALVVDGGLIAHSRRSPR